MQYRTLGRTGIKVSPFALGTMMFGPMGNPDHDDAARIIHKALDAGINFVDTADRYSAGESEEIVGKALKGRREHVVLATKVARPDGGGPQPARRSRVAGSSPRSRTRCAGCRPTTSTSTRSTGPRRRPTSRRRSSALSDLVHAGKVRAIGSSTHAGLGDRRGPVGGRAPWPRAVPHRATAVLHPQPHHRARGAAGGAALRHGHPGLEPAGQGDAHRPASARVRTPTCAVPAIFTNFSDEQRLDAVEQLAVLAEEAGLPMTHLAMALCHRAPRRDQRDHRSAHDGAARRPARRRGRRARRRRPRPDRQDRPARHRRRRARPVGVRPPGSPESCAAPPLEERSAA